MTVILNLSPQLEASVRQQAASGMDVEAFVIEAVKSKVGTSKQHLDQKKSEMTPDEIDVYLDEIAKLNPPVTTLRR